MTNATASAPERATMTRAQAPQEATARETPASPIQDVRVEGNKPEPLNGFSPDQARQVLKAIASKADMLQKLLMELAMRSWREEPATQLTTSIEAATEVSTMIGLLADSASGGEICGDMYHWLCGPSFARKEEAV